MFVVLEVALSFNDFPFTVDDKVDVGAVRGCQRAIRSPTRTDRYPAERSDGMIRYGAEKCSFPASPNTKRKTEFNDV